MIVPSMQRKIMRASLLLPIYGQLLPDCGSGENGFSYANQDAQNYLGKVTKPCFDALHRTYEQLSQDHLVEMRENLGKATRVYNRLIGLEKSRARIQANEQTALETIEQKIEDCLGVVEDTKQALCSSTARVQYCLSGMRDYLEAYDKLLRHLENRSKEQHYWQLLIGLEKECNSCRNHPICNLDTDEKRSSLLLHLRDKRWRETERCRPTRADMMEAIYMGW